MIAAAVSQQDFMNAPPAPLLALSNAQTSALLAAVQQAIYILLI
jgi:hypothetical protein